MNARTVIVASGVSWRRLNADGFDRLLGKGIFYGAARSEASIAQGLDVHLIGAGNSAGQAAMFFANHARTVTLIVRADALEKSMSQYLIDQIRTKSNIRTALRSEVTAVYGESHLTAIDIFDRGANEVRREESGGLFVFIGAEQKPAGFRPKSRVTRAAIFSPAAMWSKRVAGRRAATPIWSKPAYRACSPAATFGSVR